MPRHLTDEEREDFAVAAFDLKERGVSFSKISAQLGIHRDTVKRLIEKESGLRAREAARTDKKQIAISRYERVIEKAFGVLEKIDVRVAPNSPVISGCLRNVIDAQSKIDEIEGYRAPIRKDVHQKITQILDFSVFSDDELAHFQKFLDRAMTNPNPN